jgi:serralysin
MKNKKNSANVPKSPDVGDEEENQKEYWCYTWLASAPLVQGADRAALLKNVKWTPGDRITISFLDGDLSLRQKVIDVARLWVAPGLANLTLDFRNNTNETDIRISFLFKGSWSVLGKTCRQITDVAKPTMNFGWLTADSNDEEIRRVVLHEFGHALGLTHEHMNPDGNIQWNKQQVIKDLSGDPNNWSDQEIQNNMFRVFDEQETNFTVLDPRSIMMYPIPARWTLNGFSVRLNSQLSDLDKTFIKEEYP